MSNAITVLTTGHEAAGRPAPAAGRVRFGLVDTLRGLAAVVIAAHHLCAYGPLSDVAAKLVPQLVDWLWTYGRMTVQVFFVISGFVTAYGLSSENISPAGFTRFAAGRYVRLGLPYLVVLGAVVALYAFVPASLGAFPLVDGPVSWESVLAHAAFLQGLLGYPSLSAGIWYLAIDIQFGLLFYLLILIHRGLSRLLARWSPRLDGALLLVLFAPLALGSVFVWNLDPAQDVGVHYYFGSLFVGIVAGWVLAGRVPAWAFWAYIGVAGLGLAVQWRDRLALALVTGVLIYLVVRAEAGGDRPRRWPLPALGRISYSLFLVHYPVFWALSGVAVRRSGDSAALALLWMGVSFAAALAAAVGLYGLAERPGLRLASRLRRGSGRAA